MALHITRGVSRRNSTACCGPPAAIAELGAANSGARTRVASTTTRFRRRTILNCYSRCSTCTPACSSCQLRRATAMGKPRGLHSGNGRLRRTGAAAGRHCRRDARSVSAAKPWDSMSKRFTITPPRRTRIPAVGTGWSADKWKMAGGSRRARQRSVWPGYAHFFARRKIAYQYWLQYEYTQDRDWLAGDAYPVLKNVAEFYRHYPNVRKEDDGKYHIHDVNATSRCGVGKTPTKKLPR